MDLSNIYSIFQDKLTLVIGFINQNVNKKKPKPIPADRPWTEEELATLQRAYEFTKDFDSLCKAVPTRTPAEVARKIKTMLQPRTMFARASLLLFTTRESVTNSLRPSQKGWNFNFFSSTQPNNNQVNTNNVEDPNSRRPQIYLGNSLNRMMPGITSMMFRSKQNPMQQQSQMNSSMMMMPNSQPSMPHSQSFFPHSQPLMPMNINSMRANQSSMTSSHPNPVPMMPTDRRPSQMNNFQSHHPPLPIPQMMNGLPQSNMMMPSNSRMQSNIGHIQPQFQMMQDQGLMMQSDNPMFRRGY